MTKNQKIFSAVAIVFTTATVFIYKNYNPSTINLFPKCAFKTLTGYSCPGCGGQRALHSLLNGEIKQAFFYNPILFVAVPYLFLLITTNVFAPEKKLNKILNHYITSLTIFFIIIAYWILRNVL